jgi:hypothetical protein
MSGTELTFDLFPELYPEESSDSQGFKKTRTIASDRDDVYVSDERTNFKVGVRRVYMANGFADAAEGNMTKVSLIILDVWLHSTGVGHRFENMQVTFSLEDLAESTAPAANPSLVNWAPFKNKTDVKRSVEKQRLTTTYGGELGGSYYVDIKATYEKEKEVEKEEEFYEEWHSTPTTNPTTGKLNGIRLSGIANQSQKSGCGLFGTVRFAILLKRDAAVPWMGRFQIRTYGGVWENLVSTTRRWLGLDPRRTILELSGVDDYVHKDSPEGDIIDAKVDRNNLAVFVDAKELAKLVVVQ